MRTHLIGWTSSLKNLIGQERESKSTWLAELPAPKNRIGREWESEITWLTELPAPKNLIGREWNSESTWLAESGTAKAADWLNSQSKKTWLAGFYMCWNLIGRFLKFFWLLWFLFFWPLRMTHRCYFDLWLWLIEVLLTFEHDSSRFGWLLVLMFFWPWHKPTHKLFFFIRPSLQSRE